MSSRRSRDPGGAGARPREFERVALDLAERVAEASRGARRPSWARPAEAARGERATDTRGNRPCPDFSDGFPGPGRNRDAARAPGLSQAGVDGGQGHGHHLERARALLTDAGHSGEAEAVRWATEDSSSAKR